MTWLGAASRLAELRLPHWWYGLRAAVDHRPAALRRPALDGGCLPSVRIPRPPSPASSPGAPDRSRSRPASTPGAPAEWRPPARGSPGAPAKRRLPARSFPRAPAEWRSPARSSPGAPGDCRRCSGKVRPVGCRRAGPRAAIREPWCGLEEGTQGSGGTPRCRARTIAKPPGAATGPFERSRRGSSACACSGYEDAANCAQGGGRGRQA